MADVFISYSRKDIAFARRLHAGLIGAGLDTWIDWEDIAPSTDWMEEIQESIEQAETFIFIISSRSVTSETCSHEVTHAADNHKRLIPIVIDEIQPANVPPFIGALNWIFFREQDDFEASLALLLDAIHTDQVWVKAHTRYQSRALEWDRGKRSDAYLLGGSDVEEAESWLTDAEGKDPVPTGLQRDFILASRRSSTRRQRLVFGGLAGALAVALALSAFAFIQRGVAVDQRDLQATAEAQAVSEAQARATSESIAVGARDARATAQAESQTQRDVAVSQYLGAQSASLSKYQLERKLLLAVEATRFYPGAEARSSLLDALLAEPYFSGIVMEDVGFAIQSLALTIDGTRMAVGGTDGRVLILDCQAGTILAGVSAGDAQGAVVRLDFSSDGSAMISVHASAQAILWDLRADVLEETLLSSYPEWKTYLAVNHDASEVAALTTRGDVAIFDAATGELLQRLEESSAEDAPMVFSPDGARLAAFHERQMVYLWDRASGQLIRPFLQLPEGSSETVSREPLRPQFTLAFSIDGQALIAGTGHKTVYWDISSQRAIGRDASIEVGFDSRGVPMAFARSMFRPFQMQIETGEITGGPLETSLGGDPFAGDDLGYFWSPLSQQVFYVWLLPEGGTLIVRYDFTNPIAIRQRVPDTLNFSAVAAVPLPGSSVMIAVGCAEPFGLAECGQGMIQFWDARSGEALGDPILAHTDWIRSIAISPDGLRFATASPDGTLQLWDLQSRTPLGDPLSFEESPSMSSLKFHPSGSRLGFLAGTGASFGIYTLDVESHELVGEPLVLYDEGEVDGLQDFAFSPDGRRMAVAQGAWILTMWDITRPVAPSLLFSVELGERPSSIAFRPDGEQVAIGIIGGVMLINADTGDIEFVPRKDAIEPVLVFAVAYSRDGTWIAALRLDDTIQLYDGATGISIGPPLPGLDRAANFANHSLDFSSDGSRLMTTNIRRDIVLWDVDLADWQAIACRMANRNLTQSEQDLYLEGVEPRATCPQ
jgi:WD40 repeat protein